MNHFTPVGKSRFIHFLSKIENLLNDAAAEDDPGRFIYSKDMRTPLFMLEALSRIYKKILAPKKIKKINKVFKDIEDFLGQIDYYDGFYKEFADDKKVPGLITQYAKDQTDKKIKEFNKHLKKEEWIGSHKKQLANIYEKIDSIEWFDEKNDTVAVLEVYQNDIEKIIKKYKDSQKEFTDMEKDVHELRRELRWLSIYPQALLGLMELKADGDPPGFLNKYLTPEIINAPYNKMPDGSGLGNHILLNQNYYFGLSWMIARLGKLKDSGLKVELLEESISKVYKAKENVSQLAYSICDENQPTILQILEEAQSIAKTFFDEDILEHIVVSVFIS
ncbi:MAG: hypothetical protein KGM16_14545 [Bacteroidota bacterium]|nr:hypothetical protein [Bacteroidota bacterium]